MRAHLQLSAQEKAKQLNSGDASCDPALRDQLNSYGQAEGRALSLPSLVAGRELDREEQPSKGHSEGRVEPSGHVFGSRVAPDTHREDWIHSKGVLAPNTGLYKCVFASHYKGKATIERLKNSEHEAADDYCTDGDVASDSLPRQRDLFERRKLECAEQQPLHRDHT